MFHMWTLGLCVVMLGINAMGQDQPTKILLALQFWKGDKDQAMRVARLIADLEPRHTDFADFLFVSRFDCEQDLATVEYVSQKFNVHTYVNRHRRGTGCRHGLCARSAVSHRQRPPSGRSAGRHRRG